MPRLPGALYAKDMATSRVAGFASAGKMTAGGVVT